MARFLVLYDTPDDPREFDRHYRDVHIPLTKKLPGLRRYTISRDAAPIHGGEPLPVPVWQVQVPEDGQADAIGPELSEELAGAAWPGNMDCAALGRDPAGIVRSMQTIVRCDDPQAPAATRALLLEKIEAGVTHLVLAAVLAGRPVRWLADEIIEPVIAEAR